MPECHGRPFGVGQLGKRVGGHLLISIVATRARLAMMHASCIMHHWWSLSWHRAEQHPTVTFTVLG
jgi:hypothetical protein